MHNLCTIINKKHVVKARYLQEERSEKMLWKAVICQAIEDATSNSRQVKKVRARNKAIIWLTDDNEDFKAVCHLAGYNHKTLKKNVQTIIKR